MKVIGYVRVSTEEQASHGVSLAAQEAKIRAYADLFGHELTEVIVDGGQSAKSLTRPGLQQALAALKTGQAEGLLIAKLDRLTRSVRDLGDLLEAYFQKFALMSVGEQVDTSTAGGRMMLNLMTVMSQWEREIIGERTSAALQHLKAQGVKLGAPALESPEVLARVRELRGEGKTFREIARILTNEGAKTLKGGAWFSSTVQRLLARGTK